MAAVAGNSRIQKNRRKSTAINPSVLEKVIKDSQDNETDTSSYTRTPTERSDSNEASPPSSASSTPRLLPSRNDSVSSCCQPKPVQQPVSQPVQKGGCCSSKVKQMPEPVQVKSCCSGSNTQTNTIPQTQSQPFVTQHHGQQFQFQFQSQAPPPQYPNVQSHPSTPANFPFGLGAPIYNHAAAAYQHPNAAPMSPIANGPMSPHLPGPQAGQHAPEHNCHCGDSCSCFGCAAHPNNATMMEYVRLMAQFQYTGGFGSMPPPLYDLPTYPHHPGFGAEANQPMNFSTMNQSFSTPTPTQMSFHAGLGMASQHATPMMMPNTWQQAQLPATSMPEPQTYEPSSYFAQVSISEKPLNLKTEEIAATPVADSPIDSKEEETPTLSPSSYFWNEMVLPGCDDATGTCQCGDGCECVGCLTHGGHNGVALDAPAISETDTFPDFTNDPGLHLGDPGQYLFNHVPS